MLDGTLILVGPAIIGLSLSSTVIETVKTSDSLLELSTALNVTVWIPTLLA